MTKPGQGALDRRALLGLLAALPAAPAAARLGAMTDREAFDDVVRAIGGVAPFPAPLLDACAREFVQAFGAEALSDLAALSRRRPTLSALERSARSRVGDQLVWIARFIYSGETAEGSIYYTWCLGWQALSFATAPGQCGGPFGHWAGPEL